MIRRVIGRTRGSGTGAMAAKAAAAALASMAAMIAMGGMCAEPAAAAGDPAAEILRLEDRRESVRRLHSYLEHEKAEVRERAALAVGRIAGPAEAEGDAEAGAARALLATRLREDPAAEVRAMAAFSLGQLRTAVAGATVAALLARGAEADQRVRAAAVEALGKCGYDAHRAALAAALEDRDACVVQAALLAVWKGRCAPHLDQILEHSRSADAEIRWRAAYALMRALGAPAAGRTPIPGGAALEDRDRDRIAARLVDLAGDGDVRVRLQALRGLGSCTPADPAARVAVEAAITTGLRDADPRARVEAVRSLAALGGDGRGAPIARDPHPHVQIEIIRALGRLLDPPALVDLLGPVLDEGSEWERAVAVETIAGVCRRAGLVQQALHVAERALDDPAWSVRYAAAAEVAEVWTSAADSIAGDAGDAGGRALLAALMQRCLTDEPRVAKGVVAAWIDLRARSGADAGALLADVRGYLDGGDAVLRALALGALQGPAADAALAERLRPWIPRLARDPDPDVRAALSGLVESLAARDSVAWCAETALLQPPPPPDLPLAAYRRQLTEAHRVREAVIRTAGGELRFELLGDEAPLTVLNFARLAESGFYDGGAWHRVVPDFVVQDGCPRGDGWGGPGHTLRCETTPRSYAPGMVGMALSGKDTGGSQFFFTLSDQPHLDGRYTIFGRLLEGAELLENIAQGEEIESLRIIRR